MKLQKFLAPVATCFVLLLILLALPTKAEAKVSGNFTYTVSNSKATITAFNNDYMGDVTIPSKLGGYTVTTIGANAFSYTAVEEVTIPSTITSIHETAFAECSFLTGFVVSSSNTKYSSDDWGVLYNKAQTTLIKAPYVDISYYIIPETVKTIGAYAFFSNNMVEKMWLPDHVTTIGKYAFYGCEYLDKLYLPNKLTTIGEYAFSCCNELDAVMIPGTVTSFGKGAFSYCDNLSEVFIGNGVKTIGVDAFRGCPYMWHVTLPETIATISSNAFGECDELYEVYYFGSSTQWGKISVKTGNTNLTEADRYYISSSCGENATWSLTNTGVLIISGTGAMYDYPEDPAPWDGCRYFIEEVDVQAGITSIGEWAFGQLVWLEYAFLPDSVTVIDDYAFADCECLFSVFLGSRLEYIGAYAFVYCENLSSVTFRGAQAHWQNLYYAFKESNEYLFSEVVSLSVYPTDKCGDNLTWTLNSAGTLTISGTGAMYDYSEYMVTSPWFDSLDDIQKIVINSGATSIGQEAFQYTDAVSVSIPSTVKTIGDYAFYECMELTSVTIPSSVTSIGELAFFNCGALTKFTVNSSNANFCSDSSGVLFNKNKTTLIQAPCSKTGSYTIPDSVTTIADSAFYRSKFSSVTIGKGVTEIPPWAFELSALESITIPEGVKQIGSYAFAGTYLTEVVLPGTVTAIGEGAFIYCGELANVTMTNAVKTIGGYAFFECQRLENVYYYGNRTQWNAIATGEGAWPDFEGWIVHYMDPNCGKNLTWTYNNGTLTISGTGAMYEYGGNSDVPWFTHRDSIQKVVINSGVTTISQAIFAGYEKLTSVTIPETVTAIGDDAFRETGLTSVAIPNSVTSIGECAFGGNSKLTSVTIGNGLPTIPYACFSDCEKLTSVTLGTGVTAIEGGAFSGCSALQAINLPGSLQTIGESAFYGCAALQSIKLPNGLSTIPDSAFAQCRNLASVRFGSNINTVGTEAFFNCSALKDVYFRGTQAQWDSLTIRSGNDPLKNASLHLVETEPGDMNTDDAVTTDDAVYLLLHVMFGSEFYPVPAILNKDLNADGFVSTDDAVHLLLHVMFGETYYPI